jgi:hypothetical protein
MKACLNGLNWIWLRASRRLDVHWCLLGMLIDRRRRGNYCIFAVIVVIFVIGWWRLQIS